jgi:hydroxyethylthiazole kinase
MINFTRLDSLRQTRPLIHCVSNIVSAGDCANLALAVGASPIMAQAAEEMDAITAASRATVLNTGTPDEAKFEACLLCGRAAQAAGQPLVLDPVGVGASPWRLRRIGELLHLFTPSILRVNLGEAQALLRLKSQEQGVDSPVSAPLEERLSAARALARQHRSVVLLSGPEDLVTDGDAAWRISGGSSRMAQVTGTGCMLSVLCGVFAAVEPDMLSAAALASAFWKVCSQQAETAAAGKGPASFRAALLDAAGLLTPADFAASALLSAL